MATLEALVITALLTLGSTGVFGNSRELSTTAGDTVHIPCLFGEGRIRNIYWYYNDGTGPIKILTFFKGTVTVDTIYAYRATLHDDNSTLILSGITVNDEGTYRCDVDREGQTAVPNINTKLNVFSLTPDTLPEIAECTDVACIIYSNKSISITCALRNVYPVEDVKLIWYQDGQLVTSPNDLTLNDDGTIDLIRPIQVSDSGNFTCNASFLTTQGAENAAVSVGVTITPEPDNKNAPGNNLTKGTIAGIAIGVVTAAVVVTVAIIRICYRPICCSRGNRSGPEGQKYSPVKGSDDIASSSSATTPPPTVHTNNTTAAATMTNATISSSTPQAGSNSAHTTPAATTTTTTTTTNSTYITTAVTTTNATPTTSSSTQEAASTSASTSNTTAPSSSPSTTRSSPIPAAAATPSSLSTTTSVSTSTSTATSTTSGATPSTTTAADAVAPKTAAVTTTTTTTSTASSISIACTDAGGDVQSQLNINGNTKSDRDYTPSKADFDDILEEVAKKVRNNSEIDTLGKKLGFQPEDIQGYIATNHKTHQITTEGTLQMLRDWRKHQTESTERSALKTALEQAGQIRLADNLFPHK